MNWLRLHRALVRWVLVAVLLVLGGAAGCSGITAFSYPDLVAHLRTAGLPAHPKSPDAVAHRA
jgi:hypothetical protein